MIQSVTVQGCIMAIYGTQYPACQYLYGGLGHPGQRDEDVLLEGEAETKDSAEGNDKTDGEADGKHSETLDCNIHVFKSTSVCNNFYKIILTVSVFYHILELT